MVNLLKKIKNKSFFVLTNIFREGKKKHYFFVGKKKYEENKTLINKIESGRNYNKNNVSKVFGKYICKLIVNSDKDDIIFINQMIWLSDTIFDIKIKIFSYLSSQNKFFIKKNQFLMIDVNKKKMLIDCLYKNNNEEYIPEFDIDKAPEIDTNFVDNNNIERKKFIRYNYTNNKIIYDIFNDFSKTFKIPLFLTNPHIYFYSLEDELKWIKNTSAFEATINNERIWWGYIKKYWPSAEKTISVNNIERYNINRKIIKYSCSH